MCIKKWVNGLGGLDGVGMFGLSRDAQGIDAGQME